MDEETLKEVVRQFATLHQELHVGFQSVIRLLVKSTPNPRRFERGLVRLRARIDRLERRVGRSRSAKAVRESGILYRRRPSVRRRRRAGITKGES